MNLFKNLMGRGKALPPRKPRLQLEALEDRSVPTATIQNYVFPIYDAMHNQTGVLYNLHQTGNTFTGTIQDNSTPFNAQRIPITGSLHSLNNGWDSMVFSGATPAESVSFNGVVNEGTAPDMEGIYSESYHYEAWVTAPNGVTIPVGYFAGQWTAAECSPGTYVSQIY